MSSLVFVTQLVDPDDSALGFVTESIAALAAEFDRVDVIANEVRCVPSFPGDVDVHSLGKERGAGRAERGWRFERTLSPLLRRGEHYAVFAHMCPDYLTLAAPIAKARHVRTMLWFAHPSNTRRLVLAERLADRIVTSLPGSYPRRSSKVRVIGQAIDTDRFSFAPPAVEEGTLRLVAIGRMSDAKRYDLALAAVGAARARGVDVTLRIVGPAINAAERENERELRQAIDTGGLSDAVVMNPAVEPACVPEVLARADALLNTTIDGSGDKVVFEAMATGRPVIVANRAMVDLVSVRPDLSPAADADVLADRVATVAAMSSEDRVSVGRRSRERIVADHSLGHWARSVASICEEAR
ncbi:MAG: glycosyltransferase family 4 protein [Actinomycetota bacterium]